MACLRSFSFELHFPAKRTGVGAHNSTRTKHKYCKRRGYFSTADLRFKVMNASFKENNLQELITNCYYNHHHHHHHHYLNNNKNITVIFTELRTRQLRKGRSISGREGRLFSSLNRPARTWEPASLLFSVYRGLFPAKGPSLKLSTSLRVVSSAKFNNDWSYASTVPEWRGQKQILIVYW